MKEDAFTLLEVVLALAITATCVVVLVALFAFGLKNTQDAQMYSTVTIISKNIHARLRNDPDWPVSQIQPLAYTNGIYQTNFYYNFEGLETPPTEAIFRAEMNFVESSRLPYRSSRLDFIFIDFYEAKNNRFIARHDVQRAHPGPRP